MNPSQLKFRVPLVACILLATLFAWAQGRGPLAVEGPMLAIQSLSALQSPAVQKELSMTAEQSDHVRAVGARAMSDLQAKVRGARKNPLAAFNTDRLRREAMENWDAATDKALAVLDDRQSKRLKEICVQIGGPLAAANREVEPDLEITTGQRGRIESEIKNLRSALKRADNAKARSAEVSKTQDRIASLLSDEQRQRLRNLRGAPFQLPAQDENTDH